MFGKIRKAFGNFAEDVVRESHAWKIQCTSCGRQRSLASVGGIRYGGFGTSYTLGMCSQCGGFRMLRIYKPEKPPASPSA
ncbi:hypothetical protein [Caulobacter segnis]|uniref:Uncharacterized protein n=1 Tax=Caulobacter segnis TaxID=88688 RepID=A0A2W5WY28_9CAUL|nr:hypothetical protein [Caulobacter segnis]PZR33034.1 MAG: hypothetical protein DI526_14630 [Caulobacter segnis]